MKKLILTYIGIFLLCSSSAWGALVTSTIVFDYGTDTDKVSPTQGTGPPGDDFWTLKSGGLFGGSANPVRFAQDIFLADFNLLTFDSFTIEVRHRGNRDTWLLGEKWFMDNTLDGNRETFGSLSKSRTTRLWGNYSYWVVDEFTISSGDLFDAVLENAKFHIHFSDWGWASNTFQIDYLQVTATGSPVPLPGAVWLLGSGLVGLAGWRKLRK